MDRELLEAVLANDVAAIRVPNFVTADVCTKSVAAIEAHGFSCYRNVEPPIGRIGITQYEHRTAREEYFHEACGSNEARARLFSKTTDPVLLMIDALCEAWGSSVELAKEPDGQSYFAGVIRIIGEALIHCDWAIHDAPDWAIGSISAQLTWNIYYTLSESGGETTVFKRPWTMDLEAFANAGDYGYSPMAVDGSDRQIIAPDRGDLLIFNSRNLHRVSQILGTGRRITASSFIGRTPSDILVLWS
ncbi:MAG: hypothetical protein ACRDSR_16185 [Pseudonocardiaceae bacterium]